MFYTYVDPIPLLIKTTDEKLKKYGYESDNRRKFGILKIDSKYGNFNGQATRSLFDYTIDQDLTETLINQKLEEAKKSITFEKGVTFQRWNPEAAYKTLLAKANGAYEVEIFYQSKDWLFSKNGNIITLEDYVGSSQDVVIPTATDLEYNGLQVQISSEVLKDAAVNAQSIKTSDNGNSIHLVGNTNSIFAQNTSLKQVIFTNLDVSDVTDMNYMFSNCSNLTSVNLSSFNTENVTDMNSMFNDCSRLTSVDLSSFNIANATNMRYMFHNYEKILIPLLIKTTDEKLKNYNYVFDRRIKFGTLKIDSKYGNFNGQATRSLFDYTIDQDLTETL
ncbi:DUF285 domain-containing protein, partial [Enterococcus sp. ZJ1622]|uniref:DUF285 domain-containing protein n=1 Tax=Enterococcus sp. ZJ1622 TaxID=2709401 RepID=UPI001F14CC37